MLSNEGLDFFTEYLWLVNIAYNGLDFIIPEKEIMLVNGRGHILNPMRETHKSV